MTKNKPTELVTVDSSRVAALRGASGVTESAGTKWPAKIKVNRSPLDKDNNQLPMGKFVIVHNGVSHYLTDVDMIIMEKGTQFMRFTNKGDYIGCTMIENSFNPEYKDSLGGTRLGRVSGMNFEDMTDAQKEVKFHFHMIGVADISKATDASGVALYDTKVPLYVPAALQFKGKKSVLKQDEFAKLKKKNESYFDFVTHLSKPFRSGDVDGMPYYDYVFERGDNVTLTNELLDSIEAAKDLISGENKRIYGLHLKAQHSEDTTSDADYTDLDLKDVD